MFIIFLLGWYVVATASQIGGLFDYGLYEQLPHAFESVNDIVIDYEKQVLQYLPITPPEPQLVYTQYVGLNIWYAGS